MKMFYKCRKLSLQLFVASILVFTLQVQAEDYPVTDRDEIITAMNQAQPGDTLTMANGVWRDQNIQFSGNGVPGDSILLRAETPGYVILNGSSRLSIDGQYLKVDGLRLVGGYNTGSAIVFESGSQHCRVTNTEVSEFNPPNSSTRYHWIILKGSHNRVDHCFISGKRHSGVSVLVSLSTSPYGFHRIDHNHFADIPLGDGNGYETIKISSGAYSNLSGNTIVENNYFYRCSGEMEIISNKCHNNIYRYNTFVECVGTLTMRQGMNCTIQGNYFFGNNVDGTGGVRITHRGHKLFNNYFQDLAGTGQRSAISLYTGMAHEDYIIGEGGHVRADSITIAHNSIVNCASGINSGAWDDDDPILLPPIDNVIANNIVTMDDDAPCYDADSNYPGVNETWESNMFSGSNLGDTPDIGYVEDDPALIFTNDWYQISASSPAVDAASGDYPFVVDDIDGLERDGSKDIGADELGSGNRQPLTSDDVGPAWIGNENLPLVVSVTTAGTGSGTVLMDPPSGVYEPGTELELIAVPDEGHHFESWFGDVSGSDDTISIIVIQNMEIGANFSAPVMYTISIWNSSGNIAGSVDLNPASSSYPPGTIVTVTALPAAGYEFSHWGGDLNGSNSNPDTLLMDDNKAIMVNFHQTTSISDENATLPESYALEQNYPNPFNPSTVIKYDLIKSGVTRINIYDSSGRLMAQLLNQVMDAGHYKLEFDGSDLPSGVYIYTLESGNFLESRKMILLR